MSILRCDKHGHWDSDKYERCPRCAEWEPVQKSVPKPAPRLKPIYNSVVLNGHAMFADGELFDNEADFHDYLGIGLD